MNGDSDDVVIDYENPTYIPDAEIYASFFKSAELTELERDVLLVQLAAPDHCARNAVIGEALSKKLPTINSATGRIGSKVIEKFEIELPKRAQAIHALSWFQHHDDGFYYSTMHTSLVKALTRLGWAEEARRRFSAFWDAYKGEHPSRSYWEGREREAAIIRRARNGQARQACIEHYGTQCFVCAFDFGRVYGQLGEGFIEVHHLEFVSAQDEAEYEIDPVKDLRPVCSNCHRMLHRGGLIAVEDLKAAVRKP